MINAIAGASDAVYASLKTEHGVNTRCGPEGSPPPYLARLRLVSLLVCSTQLQRHRNQVGSVRMLGRQAWDTFLPPGLWPTCKDGGHEE